ncbi:CoA transferase [bacterium]|nr:CoA transferase [bacterium]
MVLPLQGLKVLDSALQYPGPYCSMLLGDMGADVIKIERPGIGDPARLMEGFFRSINRNKKSITLNLKEPKARDILYRLVGEADIFTEGFRPEVSQRLGIDYQTLKDINPGLIYCSISGFGQDGPYRDRPGHDLNYLALSGMLSAFTDSTGNPIQPGIAVGDLSAGMFAAIGILGALQARHQTGRGQHVDISMFDGLLSWMSTRFGVYFTTGESSRLHDPGYGIYKAKDSRSFSLGIAYEDWFWERLCSAIGLDELKNIPVLERISRRSELVEKLQAAFKTKTLAELMELLTAADVPIAPINSMKEVIDDPHVRARNMIEDLHLKSGAVEKQIAFPVKFSETPAQTPKPPPDLGYHTVEVLSEAGFNEAEIAEFKASGVI